MVAQISQKTHQPAIPSFSNFTSPSTIQSFNLLETVQSKRVLATIESIATGTPDYVIRQSDAAKVVANLPSLDQNRARIEKIYTNTQIDTRHLAVDLLSDDAIAFSRTPSNIQARMQLYKEQAIPLAEKVAKQALERASQHSNSYCPVSPVPIEESIRLIVFVSSTGFVGPGVDAALIDKLGLRRDISRVTVNFMGCAAAMNGLRVASDHVRANPTHKALVICLELSSVNAVFEDDLNDVIIHSIFGDGCAAVVVGACEEHAIAPGQVIIREHLSYLIENTEDGIILGINDNGITCRLSRQLPDYIENGVEPVIQQFLTEHDLTKADIDLWAIHPGGTRIIQKAQQSLGLSDRQVETSWEILRHYGNMLSASVLFVLEQMLFTATHPHSDLAQDSLTGLAFSFSPGVGIEGLLFQKV